MNINGVLNECFDNVVKILYVADGLKAKEAAYKDKFKPKLDYLEKFLGNNNWLLGYPTYADFVLVELSYYFEHIYPELFPQLKFLIRLRENFSKLPEIQKYYEQQSSIKAPFTSMNFSNLKF
jgi:glutathione S-transferase